ncbi:two-component regulator propeller domain-containing protein [Chitinophaga agri]|uniref:histidine kinase n=1 Tax=Chitinophaga agri TaxID=2703787 RepID=A0A6B9ZCF6_9BACT|nr:two-component regulator propeller domain-containing protein [Chitinophaga agri]QHS60030.1 response regulator [Chitinophaga agri]
MFHALSLAFFRFSGRCLTRSVMALRYAFLPVLTPACLPAFCQAPVLHFRHLTNEQGLSNSTVESIFQDSRGFMWFGTRDGLNKYDGYQVVVYRYSAEDSTSISDNYIKYIYEDRQQNLWVATQNGLNRFDARKNSFTRFRHKAGDPRSLGHNQVTCIYEDTKGRLWVGTDGGGLDLLDRKTGTFTHYRATPGGKDGLPDNRINGLWEDNKGTMLLATGKGVALFDGERDLFFSLPLPVIDTNAIRTIKGDDKGNLWIGTEEDGLFCFHPGTGAFDTYTHREQDPASLSTNQIRAILCDSKGHLWTGGINGGLDLLNQEQNTFYHYQNAPEYPRSLSQRTVSAIFEDKQGILWVGTHRGGINIYVPGAEKFPLYQQDVKQNSLSYNDVKAFCEDDQGRIWIGTDGGGLNLFDRKTQTFRHYQYNAFKKNTIGSNEVLSITQDRTGRLWIGTWGGGLNLYHPDNESFTRFLTNPSDQQSISSNYVQKVLEDRKGRLWVATYYGGVNIYDPEKKQFKRFTGSGGTALSGRNAVSMIEDPKGRIWIGTDDGGLNCYNPATGRITRYFTTGEKTPDLRVLFTDHKGRLWAGQYGLYLYNEAVDSFALYTSDAGLGTAFIKGIAEDKGGYFWISTAKGIISYHPEKHTFKTYNTGDGLQGLEFEANAYLQSRDGLLLFGGINGFNAFYPGQIHTNTFTPPVYITDLLVDNQRMLPGRKGSPLLKDISMTDKVSFNHTQTSFSFSFAVLDYSAPQNNQYAYKLDGWDRDWNYVGNERKAVYTNLNPGTYVFHVKATNSDGVWNEKDTAVIVVIHPPFWRTWWFMLLLSALILYIIYRILAFRRATELKKISEKKKEEVHQLKLQFFTNISHEFRTPLTLILGPLEKMIRDAKDSGQLHYFKLMQKNAYRLLDLVNEVMDFRKVESGVLQLKVMPANPTLFLEEIAEEFREWAVEKQIRFTVSTVNPPAEAWFDNQVLEKIIYNLLSNAFKYTPAGGEITLEMRGSMDGVQPSFPHELVLQNEYNAAQYLHIRLVDNGTGISKESISHLFERYFRVNENHLGSGIGLAFVKSLTFLHKGSIRVYSERKQGTEFIISVPFHKADYSEGERWIGDPAKTARQLESLISNQRYTIAPPVETEAVNETGTTAAATILIVDDNSELREFLKGALLPLYRIIEAADGQQGFEQAKAAMPDIIISDVMMPVMDGIAFCKLVKENLETSHIPFIMLTAKTALSSNIEGAASGADFYFGKPLSLELLLITIKNTLEQRKKSRERFLKDYFYEAKELVNSTKDKEFMETLLEKIDEHLMDPDFDISVLCSSMGMSKTNLYQKIKQLTGQSTGDFVRTIRLKKAAHIMSHEDVPLSEVILRIGIQTQSYFTKAFKKEFGKTPTQFLQELKP